jgi:Clp amino terminal domain, pathogenicity island component
VGSAEAAAILGISRQRLAQLLAEAAGEATARNHHWLGVEHLELALMHPECPGAAPRVLAFYNVPVAEAQDRYWAAWGDPFEPRGAGRTITPRVQLVLERATLEAVQLQDEEVGSEHVLLAILASGRWGSGPISSYLMARGVDAEVLRARILEVTEGRGEDRPDPLGHLAGRRHRPGMTRGAANPGARAYSWKPEGDRSCAAPGVCSTSPTAMATRSGQRMGGLCTSSSTKAATFSRMSMAGPRWVPWTSRLRPSSRPSPIAGPGPHYDAEDANSAQRRICVDCAYCALSGADRRACKLGEVAESSRTAWSYVEGAIRR